MSWFARKWVDDRIYQTCLFNSKKYLEHGTSQQYVIYLSNQTSISAPVHSHMHDKTQVLAFCGVLRGWLSTRMEANPVGNPRLRADAFPTIGRTYHVHGWRVGDAYPLSAVLWSMWSHSSGVVKGPDGCGCKPRDIGCHRSIRRLYHG